MKKVMLVILVIFISSQFFACTEKTDNSILDELRNNTQPEEEMLEAPITVWGMNNYDEKFTSQFNQKHPNIEVIFDGYEYPYYDEPQSKMFQEIAAGVGPDLFILSDSIDIYDLIGQDVFYDLTKYIDNEEIFNKENYVEEVINVGRIDGKQLFIPTEFYVPVVVTVGEVIERNDLRLDEYLSWDNIKELGEIYNGENNTPFLFQEGLLGKTLFGLIEEKVIDYSLKKSNFSIPSFINLIEMSNSYYVFTPMSLARGEYSDPLDAFDDNIFLFEIYPIINMRKIEGYLEEGYTYYVYPIQRTSGSRGITVEAETLVGINKNSKNKDGCFQYINIILSDTSQLQTLYLPINKKVYFNFLEYIEKKYTDEDIGNFPDAIRNIYDNIDSCYLNDVYYSRANIVYNDKKGTFSPSELAQKMDEIIQNMFELNSEE